MELVFRGIVVALLIVMNLIRGRTQRTGDPTGNQQGFQENRLDTIILYSLGALGSLAAVVYGFAPHWIEWAKVELPDWLRIFGAIIGAGGLTLLAWSDHNLGKNFSPTLRVRKQHELIQSGPYKRIRHPIYTAGLLFMAAMFLVSSNWIVGVCWSGVIPLYWRRIPREEAMMIETFGGEYRQYMGKTGRLLPKFSRYPQNDSSKT